MSSTSRTGLPNTRVTLRHVAQQAELSITTVSRALAGYTDVAETTRVRVQLIAQRLGYRPSERARHLALGSRATLRCAVVSLDVPAPSLPHSVYAPVLPGIMAGAAAEGMDVRLVPMNSRTPEKDLANFVAEDRADGVILITASPLPVEAVRPLESARIPFVLVNRHFDRPDEPHPVYCVTPDWAEATRDAVRRLHRLGHQRITALFRSESSMTSAAIDHEVGWRKGLAECGIDPQDGPILHAADRLSMQTSYAFGHQLLTEGMPRRGERPTAIVAYTEYCAQGVLQATRDLGVSVPDELTVIGFDNVIGQFLWPPLCTYDPHFYETGEQAASLVATLMRGDVDDGEPPRRVMLPIDYVCRDTCAPAPLEAAKVL